jgi:hypothetical protein
MTLHKNMHNSSLNFITQYRQWTKLVTFRSDQIKEENIIIYFGYLSQVETCSPDTSTDI